MFKRILATAILATALPLAGGGVAFADEPPSDSPTSSPATGGNPLDGQVTVGSVQVTWRLSQSPEQVCVHGVPHIPPPGVGYVCLND